MSDLNLSLLNVQKEKDSNEKKPLKRLLPGDLSKLELPLDARNGSSSTVLRSNLNFKILVAVEGS